MASGRAALQSWSDVDAHGDPQSVFQLDAKVTHYEVLPVSWTPR